MANIADYKLADQREIRGVKITDFGGGGAAIARTPFALPVNPEANPGFEGYAANLVFNLPEGLVVDEAAVLGFVAYPQGEPEHLDYTITINGTGIPTEVFGNNTKRSLLKIVRGDVLRVGNNTITFRVDPDEDASNEDKIEFSDIVLWFQRSI